MDSYADFVQQLSELEKEIYNKRTELYNQFDLKHNYRRFVPNRMTNVVTDYE